MEGLRGHTSGYAIPTFVVDAPGGGGKIPVTPNYLISQSEHKVVLRNFEGFISTYEEPLEYHNHNPSTCDYCHEKRSEFGQSGVLGLLEGESISIKPAQFDETHARSSEPHRLSQDPSTGSPIAFNKVIRTNSKP